MKTPSLQQATRQSGVSALALVTIFAWTGCATPPDYPARMAQECVAQRTQNGLLVGVHPIFDRQELERYFGKDLVAARMLPVLVVVENQTPDASFLLTLKNCTLAEATGYGSKDNLSKGQGAAVGATMVSPFFGAAVLLDAGSKRTGLALKELREQTVSPGQHEQGFVYFNLPKPLPAKGTQMTVHVVLPRLSSNENVNFDLPFTWER